MTDKKPTGPLMSHQGFNPFALRYYRGSRPITRVEFKIMDLFEIVLPIWREAALKSHPKTVVDAYITKHHKHMAAKLAAAAAEVEYLEDDAELPTRPGMERPPAPPPTPKIPDEGFEIAPTRPPKEMGDSQIDHFMAAYEPALRDALANHPGFTVDDEGRLRYRNEDEGNPLERVPAVVENTRKALLSGTFNHNGEAFKGACKRLGIKHTRQAILDFIEQNPKPSKTVAIVKCPHCDGRGEVGRGAGHKKFCKRCNGACCIPADQAKAPKLGKEEAKMIGFLQDRLGVLSARLEDLQPAVVRAAEALSDPDSFKELGGDVIPPEAAQEFPNVASLPGVENKSKALRDLYVDRVVRILADELWPHLRDQPQVFRLLAQIVLDLDGGFTKRRGGPMRLRFPKEKSLPPRPAGIAKESWADQLVRTFNAEAGPELDTAGLIGGDLRFQIHAEGRPDVVLGTVRIGRWGDREIRDVDWVGDLSIRQQDEILARLRRVIDGIEIGPETLDAFADELRAAARKLNLADLPPIIRGLSDDKAAWHMALELSDWMKDHDMRLTASTLRKEADSFSPTLPERVWARTLEDSMTTSPPNGAIPDWEVATDAIFDMPDGGKAILVRQELPFGPSLAEIGVHVEEANDDGARIELQGAPLAENFELYSNHRPAAFYHELHNRLDRWTELYRQQPSIMEDVRRALYWALVLLDSPRCREATREAARIAVEVAVDSYNAARERLLSDDPARHVDADDAQPMLGALRQVARRAAQLALDCAGGQQIVVAANVGLMPEEKRLIYGNVSEAMKRRRKRESEAEIEKRAVDKYMRDQSKIDFGINLGAIGLGALLEGMPRRSRPTSPFRFYLGDGVHKALYLPYNRLASIGQLRKKIAAASRGAKVQDDLSPVVVLLRWVDGPHAQPVSMSMTQRDGVALPFFVSPYAARQVAWPGYEFVGVFAVLDSGALSQFIGDDSPAVRASVTQRLQSALAQALSDEGQRQWLDWVFDEETHTWTEPRNARRPPPARTGSYRSEACPTRPGAKPCCAACAMGKTCESKRTKAEGLPRQSKRVRSDDSGRGYHPIDAAIYGGTITRARRPLPPRGDSYWGDAMRDHHMDPVDSAKTAALQMGVRFELKEGMPYRTDEEILAGRNSYGDDIDQTILADTKFNKHILQSWARQDAVAKLAKSPRDLIGPMRFGKDRPEGTQLISRDPEKTGLWRVTRFDETMDPIGHFTGTFPQVVDMASHDGDITRFREINASEAMRKTSKKRAVDWP